MEDSSPRPGLAERAAGAGLAPYAAAGALLFVWIVALFVTPRVPSQDGPTHLANARYVLERVLGHEWGRASGYFVLRPRLVPNWLESILLPPLVGAFGAATGEKLLAAGAVVCLVVGFGYALGAGNGSGRYLLFASLPLAFNLFFAAGFWNYCYGLGFLLLAVGYWRRRGASGRAPAAVVLAAALGVLFFVHLVPLVAALVMLACLAVAGTLSSRGARGARWREPAALCLAAAPAAILTLAFLGSEGERAAGPWLPPWQGRLSRFVTLDFAVSHSRWDVLAGSALVLLLGVATIFAARHARSRSWRRSDGYVVGAVLLTLVYFLVPDGLPGGGFVTERVLPFPFFAWILWLGEQELGAGPRRALSAVGWGLAACAVALQVDALRRMTPDVREFLSVEAHVADGSTLVPFVYRPEGRDDDGRPISMRVGYLAHASGWISADRPVVTFDDYEAPTGHFPLRFRAGVDPYRHFWGRVGTDPGGAFDGWRAATGRRIDYVLFWDEPDPPDEAAYRRLLAAVESRYERVFVSQNGRARLYRLRGDAAESDTR